ncbi:MAG TPA: hypothetical protein VMU51_38610 [Mycobacteriales bacterium]|nr:hypothetical protein [Mycobacteriales bacterium]
MYLVYLSDAAVHATDVVDRRASDLVTEIDFLEAMGTAATKGVPAEVAGIVKEAVMAVEETELRRAVNDYQRVQRLKVRPRS